MSFWNMAEMTINTINIFYVIQINEATGEANVCGAMGAAL